MRLLYEREVILSYLSKIPQNSVVSQQS